MKDFKAPFHAAHALGDKYSKGGAPRLVAPCLRVAGGKCAAVTAWGSSVLQAGQSTPDEPAQSSTPGRTLSMKL